MANFNRKWDKIAVHQTKNELFKIINIWKSSETLMVRFISFKNSILSILSAFLWEIQALLLPKKNFLLKYASHKYKMTNKGSEIPLFPKKYQIF